MNPTQVNSEVANAQAQGQGLQNQYNAQAAQQYGVYNDTQSVARNSQNQLQGYANQIAGQNYGDIYGQDLSSAQKMYGFDPTQLLKANLALANTNTTMANLPQAVQQQGNYYGTTAGQQASNYANLAGNLNAVQQGQSNTVNAYQSLLGATQNQANQQTTQQLAGQGQSLSAYQQAAANAVNIMQTTGTVLGQIEQLQQQQGYLTAQQVTDYQNAYSTYVSAQAAMQQANASTTAANAQSGLYGAQAQVQNLTAQQMQNQMNVANGSGSNLEVGTGNGMQLGGSVLGATRLQ